jgi:hypothetical protein
MVTHREQFQLLQTDLVLSSYPRAICPRAGAIKKKSLKEEINL